LDSRLIQYQQAYQSAKLASEDARKEQERCDEQLTEALSKVEQIQATLQATEANYSQQINVMTEHVYQLNQTITSLQHQIDLYRERHGELERQ
jgi:hypothetical protein